jgi:hypothetical protein
MSQILGSLFEPLTKRPSLQTLSFTRLIHIRLIKLTRAFIHIRPAPFHFSSHSTSLHLLARQFSPAAFETDTYVSLFITLAHDCAASTAQLTGFGSHRSSSLPHRCLWLFGELSLSHSFSLSLNYPTPRTLHITTHSSSGDRDTGDLSGGV